MLTQQNLHFILQRLHECSGTSSIEEMLQQKLIILSGDLFQLPPVCKHSRSSSSSLSNVCERCHLSSSLYWPFTRKFDLEHSVRHSEDPQFGRLLTVCRKDTPSQQDIDQGLHSAQRIPRSQIAYYAAPTADAGADAPDVKPILTTHNDSVHKHNHDVLHRLCGSDVLQVDTDICHDKHRRIGLSEAPEAIQEAFRKPHFHLLPFIALNAPVILTANCHQSASNSDTGKIVGWDLTDNDTRVVRLHVPMHHTNAVQYFTRTESRATHDSTGTYTQHTFPIKLAYAFTAHKAQGKTIDKPCVVDAEATWEAGQLYVLLSRVTKSCFLTIAGNLTPQLFRPIRVRGLNC